MKKMGKEMVKEGEAGNGRKMVEAKERAGKIGWEQRAEKRKGIKERLENRREKF